MAAGSVKVHYYCGCFVMCCTGSSPAASGDNRRYDMYIRLYVRTSMLPFSCSTTYLQVVHCRLVLPCKIMRTKNGRLNQAHPKQILTAGCKPSTDGAVRFFAHGVQQVDARTRSWSIWSRPQSTGPGPRDTVNQTRKLERVQQRRNSPRSRSYRKTCEFLLCHMRMP